MGVSGGLVVGSSEVFLHVFYMLVHLLGVSSVHVKLAGQVGVTKGCVKS